MRVLLLSPLAGLDPPNGDVTYTEQLLAHPPEGVEYTDYAAALADGRLRELRRRSTLRDDPIGTVASAVMNRARSAGVLFREGVRHFAVEPGAFDLIHCHVFSTRWHGPRPPLVVSAHGPLEWVYRDAFGWSPRRVSLVATAERLLARASRTTHFCYGPGDAEHLIVPSNVYARWLVDNMHIDRSRITVASSGIERSEPRPRDPDATARVGLVAGFPEVKGANTLLDALELLRKNGHDVEVVIAGSDATDTPLHRRVEALGATWVGRRPRDVIVGEVLPSLDVLAYVSEFDGWPFGVLEALGASVPVIVSDYPPLPEMIEHPSDAGMVVPQRDAEALARAILALAAPGAAAAHRSAAGDLSRRRDDPDHVAALVGGAYHAAADARRRP